MAKPDAYKNQHLIPKSYLEAWCDPNRPEGYDPYLWRVRLADGSKFRRSPEKTFTQNNRYTIVLPDGERDLTMEKTLGQTEGDFIAVRDRIMKAAPLNLPDKAALCIFAGAMATRSERQGEHWRSVMERLHEQVSNLERVHNVDPRGLPPGKRGPDGSFTINSLETSKMVEEAHIDIIKQGLSTIAPFMYSMMDIRIFVSEDVVGFITSDSPFVMFNPELRKLPPGLRHPALMQRGVEITLPLSPHHLLFATRKLVPTPDISSLSYQGVSQLAVDEANRTTRAHSQSEIISWTGETRPYWFDDGTMPEDAWENTDEGRAFKDSEG